MLNFIDLFLFSYYMFIVILLIINHLKVNLMRHYDFPDFNFLYYQYFIDSFVIYSLKMFVIF